MERVQFKTHRTNPVEHVMRLRVSQDPDVYTQYIYVNHRPKNVQKLGDRKCYFVRDGKPVTRTFAFGKSLIDGEMYAWPHTSQRFKREHFATRGTATRRPDMHESWSRVIRGYLYDFSRVHWGGDEDTTTYTAYEGNTTNVVKSMKFPSA